jgi:putative transposase
MKQKRYTEEQIVGIVKSVEGGKGIAEVCREAGVSEATVHRWRKKYGGLEISEIRRMRQLEAENAQLKRIVAQQAMDIDALKGLLAKK